LFAAHPSTGDLFIYPELALIIGNIYVYIISPKYRLNMQLISVNKISERVFDYAFKPNRTFNFEPGQYLEWTLPRSKTDSRGNRRTFSIASSPTENLVHMGVKFYDPSSSYKKALKAMKPGDKLYAGQLAGDFILPYDKSKPLIFVAGGIGITPFRSMLKYLIDNHQNRKMTLFYLVSDPSEIAYKDVLGQAQKIGLKIIFVGSKLDSADKFNEELLKNNIKNISEARYYVSGPSTMVDDTKRLLKNMKISRNNIVTDHFSGY